MSNSQSRRISQHQFLGTSGAFEKLCPFGIDLLGESCGVQLRTEQLEKLLHQKIAIGPSNAPSGRREFVCERKMFLKQLAGGV